MPQIACGQVKYTLFYTSCRYHLNKLPNLLASGHCAPNPVPVVSYLRKLKRHHLARLHNEEVPLHGRSGKKVVDGVQVDVPQAEVESAEII